MKDHSAIDDLSPPLKSFKSEVIDDEIAIYLVCKANQGRYHLFTWTDRIDKVDIAIEGLIG